MKKTLVERLTSTDEGMRLFQQAKLEIDFTEIICGLLEDQQVSRNELAKKIDITEEGLSGLLDEGVFITLEMASRFAWAFGKTLTFNVEPLTIHTKPDEEESK